MARRDTGPDPKEAALAETRCLKLRLSDHIAPYIISVSEVPARTDALRWTPCDPVEGGSDFRGPEACCRRRLCRR
jgi:hypothetical protein